MRIRELTMASAGLAIAAALLGSSVTATAQPTDPAIAAAVAQGIPLFRTNCSGCHGADGQGGAGPRLAGNSFVSATAAIVNQIFYGVPDRGMPGFLQLTNEQVALISTAVRNSWGNAYGLVTTAEAAAYRP